MIILLAIIFIFIISADANALQIFPGAEGWGTDTIGGRSASAVICKVNTTADGSSGSCAGNICTGTLRYCATKSGPRHVIFTTGGTITLSAPLEIFNPYMTIAGQTAPGGGIQVVGNVGSADLIIIRTHDIVIRGMKFRGAGNSNVNIIGDSANLTTPTYNIVLDHNSFEFDVGNTSTAKLLAYWYNPQYSTVSRNIFAYPLTPDAMCVLVGGWSACSSTIGSGGPPANHITLHHNLFTHCKIRSPLIKQQTTHTEIINNFVYNWYYWGTDTYAATYIYGNHYVTGGNAFNGGEKGIGVNNSGECPSLAANTVYVSHNRGPGRLTDTGEEWNAVLGSISYKATSPPFNLSGVTQTSVDNVKANILADVGAKIPSVDVLDQRAINDANNGTGSIISSISEVGGIPSLSAGTYPTDTDGDGIPDTWEDSHGLNKNSSSDAFQYSSNGYQRIEEYYNDFFTRYSTGLKPTSPSIRQVDPGP